MVQLLVNARADISESGHVTMSVLWAEHRRMAILPSQNYLGLTCPRIEEAVFKLSFSILRLYQEGEMVQKHTTRPAYPYQIGGPKNQDSRTLCNRG